MNAMAVTTMLIPKLLSNHVVPEKDLTTSQASVDNPVFCNLHLIQVAPSP
jgi:hypothetical protein